MMSLEALLRAARDDEPGAWNRLAPLLWSQLQQHCRRWFGPEDAREVAQHALVVISEQLPGFEPNRSFEGWALGIARNLARRELRTRRRRRELLEAAGLLLAAPQTGLGTQADRAKLQKILMEEVEQLPEHLRSVIEHDLDDGDPEEYAGTHGINPVTVRTRRRRAHEELAKRVVERMKVPERPRESTPAQVPSKAPTSTPARH